MAVADYQQETIDRIRQLCKEKNAIILAHNYVLGEVQDVADYVGDSLELSIKARDLTEDVIIFCGVKFMAETAKVLSPSKTVIHPTAAAGCPMADMAELDMLRDLKAKHPDAVTVCYVNSTSEVKTEVDICCTSSNVYNILAKIPKEREIIFLPDKNMGQNIANEIGRDIILWPGFCPTHMRLRPDMVMKKKEEYPEAVVIAHPECRPEVVAISDECLSTGHMLKFARETDKKQIIVATELGIIHRLQKENPEKQFISVSEQAVCMTMKMTTLEDVLHALETMETEIILDDETIEKAYRPINNMIEGNVDV